MKLSKNDMLRNTSLNWKCYNYDLVIHCFRKFGLLKIHKVNVPQRIIVSSINTTFYFFAKFLNKIISDNITHTEYQVKNFELCVALSSKTIPESHSLVSLDVVSLFTNVPLDLALNSIGKRWEYVLKRIERSIKITKGDFRRLLILFYLQLISRLITKFISKFLVPLWDLLYHL